MDIKNYLVNLIVTYVGYVIGALIFLIILFFVATLCRNLVIKAVDRSGIDVTLGHFAGSVLRWAIIIMGVLASLSIFGIEATSFAAVLGASALAIGLAFRGTLSNLASGVMLLVFRPFKVGQVVKVNGVTGKVKGIDLFTVNMDTPDNRRLILPNRAVFDSTIENISFHDTRRVDVRVGVSYDASIKQVREVLTNAYKTVSNILEDPAPAVVLIDLGASSVDWDVRVWVEADNFWSVKEDLMTAVKDALDEAGIGIPYPQMDVHLDGVLTRRSE